MRAGQALVVILLIMAVGLTVGLSIVSRSVVDLGVSTTSEESARALAAAEAGIEEALTGSTVQVDTVVPVGDSDSGDPSAYRVVEVTTTGGGEQVVFGDGVEAGEVATVYLVGRTSSGGFDYSTRYTGANLTLCWASGSAQAPAMEASIYYTSGSGGSGTSLVGRAIYDLGGRVGGAIAPTPADSACPSGSYAYKRTIALNSTDDFGVNVAAGTPLFIRLRPYFNGATPIILGVRAASGSNFPPQEMVITVLGMAGQTNRRVQVTQRYPDPLPYFDNAVFSGGNLAK